MKYSDNEFSDKFNFKLGVVKEFKRILREKGILSNRSTLGDSHVEILNYASEIKDNENLNWTEAIKKAIIKYYGEDYLESDDQNINLDSQIKKIIALNDRGELNDKQTILVIKQLIN